MSDFFAELFSVSGIAVFIQATVFSIALNKDRMLFAINRTGSLFAMGIMMTVITACSSLLARAVSVQLGGYPLFAYLRPLVYFLCIGLVYCAVLLFLRFVWKKQYHRFKYVLPYTAFNCSVAGCLMLGSYYKMNFAQTAGFAIISGLGFIAVMWIVNEGHKRLALSNVPQAFRGVPITLLYVGILSMTVYCLFFRGGI